MASYLVCKDMRQFSQRDVPDEICDGFLQFKESVRIVFVSWAFHCSPQSEGCKIVQP
jgi:hypothetical protein